MLFTATLEVGWLDGVGIELNHSFYISFMLRIYFTGTDILIYKISLVRVLDVKNSFNNLTSLIRCGFCSFSSFPVLCLVCDPGTLTLDIEASVSVRSMSSGLWTVSYVPVLKARIVEYCCFTTKVCCIFSTFRWFWGLACVFSFWTWWPFS
jgi:hypothetical protein